MEWRLKWNGVSFKYYEKNWETKAYIDGVQ